MTEFTVRGSDLSRGAAWVARLIPPRPAVPVLSGIKIVAGNELHFSAFDYEISCTGTVPCATTGPGSLLVSGQLLAAVAKTVPDKADVHVSVEPGRVLVRCGRSKWSLPALPVDEFPQLPPLPTSAGTARSGDLRSAWARTLPAASREQGMEFLSGVRIEADATVLTVVATDRFRLPVVTIPWVPDPDVVLPAHVMVPAALLELAARTGGDDADPVAVAWSATTFGLSGVGWTVTGRQLATEYPKWHQLVPDVAGWHATVDVSELEAAVKQAVPVAVGDGSNLALHFASGEVEVSAAGEDRGADITVSVALKGDPITFGFNAGYLLDCLAAQTAEKVRMDFSGPTRPVLVIGVGDTVCKYLLMPIRAVQKA